MREKDLKEQLIQQVVEALQQATPEDIYITLLQIRAITKSQAKRPATQSETHQ